MPCLTSFTCVSFSCDQKLCRWVSRTLGSTSACDLYSPESKKVQQTPAWDIKTTHEYTHTNTCIDTCHIMLLSSSPSPSPNCTAVLISAPYWTAIQADLNSTTLEPKKRTSLTKSFSRLDHFLRLEPTVKPDGIVHRSINYGQTTPAWNNAILLQKTINSKKNQLHPA